MVNLLLAQMQVIDFIFELQIDLAIITNRLNLMNLNKVDEMVKNVKSASLINKNVMAAVINLTVVEVKELKPQILELKVKIRELKYVFREDRKLLQNIGGNKKPPYKGLNHKPVNKRNLKYYKYEKKSHFKSEC